MGYTNFLILTAVCDARLEWLELWAECFYSIGMLIVFSEMVMAIVDDDGFIGRSLASFRTLHAQQYHLEDE